MSKHRLQFDFTEEALKQLDDLKDAVGLGTRAELIRQALRLMQWTLTETRDKNATILVEKEGKVREVVFPFLPAAREDDFRKRGEDDDRKRLSEVVGQA